MISWKALLGLMLVAGEALAAHHDLVARHHHQHVARSSTPAKRLNRRKSCTPPTSSLLSSSTTDSTTTHTTTATSKQSSSTSGSSSSGSSSSSSGSSSGNIKSVPAAAGFTPNGIKAGTSSGNGLSALNNHIGWWYDWTPSPSSSATWAMAVPMLWGIGTDGSADASRLAAFKKIAQAPQYMLGFEEPDCASGGGSAGFSVSQGVSAWEEYIAPFQAKGTKIASPSMCHQAAETWLKQFSEQIKTDWDITNIHVNKNNMDGVRADLDHYAQYGKPIWVSEFACVDDSSGFVPCTSQSEINTFIDDIVDLFEGDSRVAAYAYSNGEGLGNIWPMTTNSGALSASGKTYLEAISKYH